MTEAAIAVGIAAQVVVWRLVARDRLPFWPATAMTFAVIGIASLLAGDPSCCRDTEVAVASGVGVMSGLILYGATRVVVDVAAQHSSVRGAVASVYRRSKETTVFTTIALTLLIAVPGEEIFWRGLVLPQLSEATTSATGALLSWAAAVGVSAGAHHEPSRLDRADARVAPLGRP